MTDEATVVCRLDGRVLQQVRGCLLTFGSRRDVARGYPAMHMSMCRRTRADLCLLMVAEDESPSVELGLVVRRLGVQSIDVAEDVPEGFWKLEVRHIDDMPPGGLDYGVG